MSAFYTLAASRSYTVAGPAPIPVSEVLAFCSLSGIESPEQRVHLLRVVQMMDVAWLASVRKQPNG